MEIYRGYLLFLFFLPFQTLFHYKERSQDRF